MGKHSTSRKQKKSSRATNGFIPWKPSPLLADREKVVQVLAELLLEGDLESFRDVLIAHLRITSKMELVRKTGVGRRTLYDLMDPKKKFDPKLSTLSALLQKIAA